MPARIQLYVKGGLFQEDKFEMPRYKEHFSFKANVELMEVRVNSQVQTIKIMYEKQIASSEGDWGIYITLESKMSNIQIEEDANES